MTNNSSRCAKQQFWENHLAQCTASGLSQAEYCRLHAISQKSFQYWKNKSKRSAVPALVEVPLPKSFRVPSLSPSLCLVIGQQYRIEIGKQFDPQDLEQVVRVLGRI